nr:hypothetical protein [uncultured Campylobacter sp.]
MNHKIYCLKLSGVKFVAITLVKFDRPRKQSVKFIVVCGLNFKISPQKNGAKFSGG